MTKFERKLKAYLETYQGEAISLDTLAKGMNVSKRTVYNNKKIVDKYDLNIVHCNSKAASTLEGFKRLTNTSANTLELTPERFEAAHSFVSMFLSIPCTYEFTEEVQSTYLSANLTVESAVKYLTRCVNTKSFLDKPSFWDTTFLLSDYKSLDISVSEFTEIEGLEEHFGCISPTREQLLTASSAISFCLSKEQKLARIQAKAGSSKTTVSNAVLAYLKSIGVKIQAVSFTRDASACLQNGSTLHSFIDKVLGVSSVEYNEEELLFLAERSLAEGLVKPIDLLLVDEYTTFSPSILRVAKLLANSILFVGDTGQNKNNSEYCGPLIGILREQYRFSKAKDNFQKDISEARFRKDTNKFDSLLESNCIGRFEGVLGIKKEGTLYRKYVSYAGCFDHLQSTLNKYTKDDSIVVAYSTEAVSELNKLMNKGSDLKQGSKVSLTKTMYRPTKVISGSKGVVVALTETTCVVNFEGVLVEVPMNHLQLAFAVTTLVAQGSRWKNVLFVGGTSHKANHLVDGYVGVSRAEVSCKVLLRTTVDDSLENTLENTLKASIKKTARGLR